MSPVSKRKKEKARFFEIAARLIRAKVVAERAELKEELARLTFGE